MTVINPETIPWEELYPGVMRRPLTKDEARGMQINLLRAQPGVKFPRHRHPEQEWMYVLRGTFEDEHGQYPAGTFKINEQGSEHSPFTSAGCEFLLIWCGRHEKL